MSNTDNPATEPFVEPFSWKNTEFTGLHADHTEQTREERILSSRLRDLWHKNVAEKLVEWDTRPFFYIQWVAIELKYDSDQKVLAGILKHPDFLLCPTTTKGIARIMPKALYEALNLKTNNEYKPSKTRKVTFLRRAEHLSPEIIKELGKTGSKPDHGWYKAPGTRKPDSQRVYTGEFVSEENIVRILKKMLSETDKADAIAAQRRSDGV